MTRYRIIGDHPTAGRAGVAIDRPPPGRAGLWNRVRLVKHEHAKLFGSRAAAEKRLAEVREVVRDLPQWDGYTLSIETVEPSGDAP